MLRRKLLLLTLIYSFASTYFAHIGNNEARMLMSGGHHELLESAIITANVSTYTGGTVHVNVSAYGMYAAGYGYVPV